MQVERVRLEAGVVWKSPNHFQESVLLNSSFQPLQNTIIFHVKSFLPSQINNRHMLLFIALLTNKCYYDLNSFKCCSGSHVSHTIPVRFICVISVVYLKYLFPSPFKLTQRIDHVQLSVQ